MRNYLITLSLILIATALYTRDPFAFALLYFFIATLLLNRLWMKHSTKHIQIERKFAPFAYPGDNPHVEIHLKNTSRIPALWIQIFDGVSAEIRADRSFSHVTSLHGEETKILTYQLSPNKRGIYQIGPLFYQIGDFLGLHPSQKIKYDPTQLIVYPKVFHLAHPEFPSRTPFGSLRSKHQINEDPTRIIGKRDYHSGDPLRNIDWKASAHTNKLQVKQFQPSKTLDVAVFLNLAENDFQTRHRIYDSELNITIAASILSHLNQIKQNTSFGIFGQDEFSKHQPIFIPSGKGNAHLMHMLTALATIQRIENTSFLSYLTEQLHLLSWGTSAIIITSDNAQELFDTLIQAKQRGVSVSLILSGTIPNTQEIIQKMKHFDIPTSTIQSEQELKGWQA